MACLLAWLPQCPLGSLLWELRGLWHPTPSTCQGGWGPAGAVGGDLSFRPGLVALDTLDLASEGSSEPWEEARPPGGPGPTAWLPAEGLVSLLY